MTSFSGCQLVSRWRAYFPAMYFYHLAASGQGRLLKKNDYDYEYIFRGFCRAMLCKRGQCRHAVSVCLSRSWIQSKRINIGVRRPFVCPSVCLSDVAYIGSNSKIKRPRKTKLCTGVPQVTCDSHTDIKVKRSKVKVTGQLVHCSEMCQYFANG